MNRACQLVGKSAYGIQHTVIFGISQTEETEGRKVISNAVKSCDEIHHWQKSSLRKHQRIRNNLRPEVSLLLHRCTSSLY